MTHRDIILRHTKAFPQWFINGQCLTWASGDGTDQFLQYSTPSEVPGAEALASGSHVRGARQKKNVYRFTQPDPGEREWRQDEFDS